MDSAPAIRARRLRRIVVPIALLVAVLAIHLASMPGTFWIGDPNAWRAEARSMLVHGRLSIEPEYASSAGERGQFFVENEENGRWYSKFGTMNALMSLPPLLVQRAVTGSLNAPQENPDLLIFNLYNVFLSVLLGAVLYGVSGRYTQRATTRVVFVLAVLYATYLWYYERAQGSEIYQALFFLCFFACLARYLEAVRDPLGAPFPRAVRWAVGTWSFVLVLVLSRVLFGALIPVVLAAFLFVVLDSERSLRRTILRRHLALVLIPPLLVVAVLAAINQIKFGSPLLTGYHQWNPEITAFSGRLRDGLWGLLFSPQYSIFLHFPLLVFALLAARTFFARHRTDAVVIGMSVMFFLLVLGKIPSWRGEWTYGPRYVAFLLPVASLPFTTFVDGLLESRRRPRAWVVGASALVALAYSVRLQVQVNRLDFFTYYHVRAPLVSRWNEEILRYFYDHHVGVICDDLLTHRERLDELAWFRELAKITPERSVEQYRASVEKLIDTGNWYWRRPALGKQP